MRIIWNFGKTFVGGVGHNGSKYGIFRFGCEYVIYHYRQRYRNDIKYAKEIPSIKLYSFHSLYIEALSFVVALIFKILFYTLFKRSTYGNKKHPKTYI